MDEEKKIIHTPLQYGETFVCSCGNYNCEALNAL